MISALTSISPSLLSGPAGLGAITPEERQQDQEQAKRQGESNPVAASAAGALSRPSDSVEIGRGEPRSRPGERATESLSADAPTKAANGEELSPDEEKQVEKLRERDAEVRQHEQAHVAAAGPYFRGGPNYSFQTGPDGKKYAVGGSVQIDTSPVPGDPEATIAKAQQVRRAALAPVEPSNTDRQVAAAASRMEAEARAELAEKKSGPNGGSDEPESTQAGSGPVNGDEQGDPRSEAGARISAVGGDAPKDRTPIDVYA